MKLCECGCGEPAPIATANNTRLKHLKGEPIRFRKGHWSRTEAGRAQQSEARSAILRGTASPKWKGDAAGYTSLHKWVRRNFEKSGRCEECSAEGKTDWANVDHRYHRVREDWVELCRSCHRLYDLGSLTLKQAQTAERQWKRSHG